MVEYTYQIWNFINIYIFTIRQDMLYRLLYITNTSKYLQIEMKMQIEIKKREESSINEMNIEIKKIKLLFKKKSNIY